jgi:hypothetical protein
LINIVVPAVRGDFPGLVARVAEADVFCRAGEVVGQAGEAGLGVVAVADGGAVAQRYGGAAREVVVAVAGDEVDGAVFLEAGRAVQGVVGGADVEAGFGPGEAGAVACRVVLVGECLATGGGAEDAAGIVVDIAGAEAAVVGGEAAAQQVVAEAGVVGGDRVAAADQAVEVVIAVGDGLASALALRGEVAVVVVAVLFVVGRG